MKIQRERPRAIAVSDLAEGAARTQVAALCWRIHEGKPQILLVTSRDTGRWIVPKGWPMAGKTAAETASAEAWEEAGVEGRAEETCLGLYAYTKMLGPERGVPCVVAVYPLRVRALARDYPERSQRRRRWFSPRRAAQKVDEPELKELLKGFDSTAAGG